MTRIAIPPTANLGCRPRLQVTTPPDGGDGTRTAHDIAKDAPQHEGAEEQHDDSDDADDQRSRRERIIESSAKLLFDLTLDVAARVVSELTRDTDDRAWAAS